MCTHGIRWGRLRDFALHRKVPLFSGDPDFCSSLDRENLNGHRYMATGKCPKDRFRTFSRVFARFPTFSRVFALFGQYVSDRFWLSVFALFRTIRLLPFSGCHLDSPDWC